MADLALAYAGISAGAAAISAFRDIWEMGRDADSEEVAKILADAQSAASDESIGIEASRQIQIDAHQERVIRKDIEEALKRWDRAIRDSQNESDPITRKSIKERATDVYKADVCQSLGMLKELNGGVLPEGDWYGKWVKFGC